MQQSSNRYPCQEGARGIFRQSDGVMGVMEWDWQPMAAAAEQNKSLEDPFDFRGHEKEGEISGKHLAAIRHT